MVAKTINSFVNDHPDGMIGGAEYRCPHRDSIWLTPSLGTASRLVRPAASFWIADARTEETRLVNALLVDEGVPMQKTGGTCGRSRRRKHE